MENELTDRPKHPTIRKLLSNSLVLHQLVPYIPISSLLALGATSKSLRSLIYGTPGVFRYLDLTKINSAQFELAGIDHGGEVWRNVQLDENVTEDDFYGGPLRGIFNRLQKQKILQDVQTLILDGLSVTSDLISEIILQDTFNVKVLSIRGVHNLNERKLQQALKYAVRPSRPGGTPKLQAMYIFGPRDRVVPKPLPWKDTNDGPASVDPSRGSSIMHAQGAQLGAEMSIGADMRSELSLLNDDKWYQGQGKVRSQPISSAWEATIQDCEGVISFDAVLCRGPRHTFSSTHHDDAQTLWYNRTGAFLPSRTANISLRGCYKCGSCPESYAQFKKSPTTHFPLLAPPPLHASTVRACTIPFQSGRDGRFLARCSDCLRARYCESCCKWWCEDCYQIPDVSSNTRSLLADSSDEPDDLKPGVIRSCFECGMNCAECIRRTQLLCKTCGGEYCTIHNEGSTLTTCDWCMISGRRTRELY